MSEIHRNSDWLEQKYVDEKLSQKEIAQLAGVSQPTISYHLEKFGVEQPEREPEYDVEWLRQKYVEECRSMVEIAEICDVTVQTISYRIKRSSIESEGVEGERNPMYGKPPANA